MRHKNISWVLLAASLILSGSIFAKNIGNYGHTFPVIEEDLRAFIMRRLGEMEKTGALARQQRDITARVTKHILYPTPLNLGTSKVGRQFHIDPSIVVNQDIYTKEGICLAHAGTTLNPFDYVTYSKAFIFFNGEDVRQVSWVRAHYKDYKFVKFVLTGGGIEEGTKTFGRVYFDINGRLVSRFQIAHVPAVVSQDDKRWLVREIGVADA